MYNYISPATAATGPSVVFVAAQLVRTAEVVQDGRIIAVVPSPIIADCWARRTTPVAAIQRAQTETPAQAIVSAPSQSRRQRHLEVGLLFFFVSVVQLEAVYAHKVGRHTRDVELRAGLRAMGRLAAHCRAMV